jgi:hypothetical protein
MRDAVLKGNAWGHTLILDFNCAPPGYERLRRQRDAIDMDIGILSMILRKIK